MTHNSDLHPRLIQRHDVKQIAFVVRDIQASMQAYWEILRIGPWTGYTLGPGVLKDMTYQGEPAEFSFHHALAWKGDVQFELVQPLEGPSIFADHLAERGEGMHHVGIYVPDQPRAMVELQETGFTCLQSARGFGAEGDGAFAYFASDNPLAAIVEVIGAPRVRRAPAFAFASNEEKK
jgi:hypothetical protein